MVDSINGLASSLIVPITSRKKVPQDSEFTAKKETDYVSKDNGNSNTNQRPSPRKRVETVKPNNNSDAIDARAFKRVVKDDNSDLKFSTQSALNSFEETSQLNDEPYEYISVDIYV